MATVYILKSAALKKSYVGSCKVLSSRLEEHLERRHVDGFTAKATDWVLFFSIDDLQYEQARKIEAHIKRMKSKTYIENLKKYPEMTSKLLVLYRG